LSTFSEFDYFNSGENFTGIHLLINSYLANDEWIKTDIILRLFEIIFMYNGRSYNFPWKQESVAFFMKVTVNSASGLKERILSNEVICINIELLCKKDDLKS